MITMGVVGLGKMGLSHLSIFRAHPDVELVAVCDSSGYVLDVLSKYTGVRGYKDLSAMLAAEHLDAVVTRFCLLTETSTSIVLNMPREHASVLPARRENIRPAIRKVTGR